MNTSTTTLPCMKKASAIRKAMAAKYGVPFRFVSLGACLKRAAGANTPMKSCFGSIMKAGMIGWKIDLYLCSPEAPVVVTVEDIMEACAVPHRQLVYDHLTFLERQGVVINNHNFLSVRNAKRPYSNLIPA